MKDTKRYSRSYKTTTSVYRNAMKRAKKEKIPLAQTLERVVSAYSEGHRFFLFLFSMGYIIVN